MVYSQLMLKDFSGFKGYMYSCYLNVVFPQHNINKCIVYFPTDERLKASPVKFCCNDRKSDVKVDLAPPFPFFGQSYT